MQTINKRSSVERSQPKTRNLIESARKGNGVKTLVIAYDGLDNNSFKFCRQTYALVLRALTRSDW